jgi:hypothetical protein
MPTAVTEWRGKRRWATKSTPSCGKRTDSVRHVALMLDIAAANG